MRLTGVIFTADNCLPVTIAFRYVHVGFLAISPDEQLSCGNAVVEQTAVGIR